MTAIVVNHKLILKFIIICLCIINITQGKKVKTHIRKTSKIHGKKHLTIADPIKKLNPEYSFENRKKFIEDEFKSFKLKSDKSSINKEKENVEDKKDEKSKNTGKEINNKIEEDKKDISKGKIIKEDTKSNSNSEGNNYYLYGGGIVSIALVGVGFFNVYQRNRNSIFSLSKEELEALDKSTKLNNSYTSLSEEERRFLHKINSRKHNNRRRYDELTEDEILEIRKKNGWADSDDGECQLRHRKIDKRLSSNIRINNTNVIAPRRISLNVKLDKDLFSKSNYKQSCDNIEKLRKYQEPSSLSSQSILEEKNEKEERKYENKKCLSIDTKGVAIPPPIKMVCTIVKSYKPLREDEIELNLGDRVEIVNVFKDGWASGKVINNKDSKIGYFPLAHSSEPEIFDNNINEFIIPSPLTPPISRQHSNVSLYQNSPLSDIKFTNSTMTATTYDKSMIAIKSSSSIISTPNSDSPVTIPSIININNNINIINNNSNESKDIPSSININININNQQNNNRNFISNSIDINSNEGKNLMKTNSVVISSPTTFMTSSNKNKINHRHTILDPQSVLNNVIEEEKIKNRITSSQEKKSKHHSLPCHSQEVFDFLRSNVYSSKMTVEEKDYYKKCLERLRISKLIDMEINDRQKSE
ncbi:hypothetical protein BCR32DRAFT_296442 [Anaeromyces robustus]|uniref:Uncharacterized protein n=1 Tax=Anaeromyces robustus TaxID=1754192 RepID=A0A1Y1WRY9_9FUNG|nr:hypothetical protein BCR32DRAFT_296442 [Anaeromyces robustus]|eukprot:ORX76155.1 hypothetical protein BCR32DRAFT_296442 [Anaeromyces robustus]